jgi:hypothetical protein
MKTPESRSISWGTEKRGGKIVQSEIVLLAAKIRETRENRFENREAVARIFQNLR